MSKLEALRWVNALLSRDARLLQEQRQLLLVALCEALGAASGAHAGAAAGCRPLLLPPVAAAAGGGAAATALLSHACPDSALPNQPPPRQIAL